MDEIGLESGRGLWTWFGGNPENRAGWKIHINVDASELGVAFRHLRKVREEFSWKIARSTKVASGLVSGRYGINGQGKLITIYPRSADQARKLIEELGILFKGLHGPLPARDRRLKLTDCISYRYGGARDDSSALATQVGIVRGPNQEVMYDLPQVYECFPPWESDLFPESYGAHELRFHMQQNLAASLSIQCHIISLLRQSSIWVARISTASSKDNTETFIVKWAVRRITGLKGVARIIQEGRLLQLQGAGSLAPELYEYVVTPELAAIIVEDLGDIEPGMRALQSVDEYYRLRDGLTILRQAGIEMGVNLVDLSPSNLRWKGETLALIDWEGDAIHSQRETFSSPISHSREQCQATLVACLTGLTELSRVAERPWLNFALCQAVEALSIANSAQNTLSSDCLEKIVPQLKDDEIIKEVLDAGLTELEADLDAIIKKVATSEFLDISQASLFCGVAGSIWCLLANDRLETASRALRLLTDNPTLFEASGGLYFGGTGIALTLAYAGVKLDDKHLKLNAVKALLDLTHDFHGPQSLFSGLAGDMVALSALADIDDSEGLRSTIRRISNELRRPYEENAFTTRFEATRIPRGLAYGLDGVALALLRANSVLKDLRREDVIPDLMLSLLKEPINTSFNLENSLCNGIIGIADLAVTLEDKFPSSGIPQPLPGSFRSRSVGACHGLAGSWLVSDPLNAKWRYELAWTEHRIRTLIAIVGSARKTASGVGWVDDRTGRLGSSLMTGSSGVILALAQSLGVRGIGLPHTVRLQTIPG